MTDDQLKEIELLSKKNESVKVMFAEWKQFAESPYVDSYLALYDLLTEWQQQIKDGKEKINIFSDKDDKSFDRASKLAQEGIEKIITSMDSIRAKMSPAQQKDAMKQKRIAKNESVAI